jgi:hypothetical protein
LTKTKENNTITIELSQSQLDMVISLLDHTIDSINNGLKDPLKLGIDNYIDLAYHFESYLDND